MTILLNLKTPPFPVDYVPHIQQVIVWSLRFQCVWFTPIEPLPLLDKTKVLDHSHVVEEVMAIYPGIVITENHALAYDTQFLYDNEIHTSVSGIREIWITKDIRRDVKIER